MAWARHGDAWRSALLLAVLAVLAAPGAVANMRPEHMALQTSLAAQGGSSAQESLTAAARVAGLAPKMQLQGNYAAAQQAAEQREAQYVQQQQQYASAMQQQYGGAPAAQAENYAEPGEVTAAQAAARGTVLQLPDAAPAPAAVWQQMTDPSSGNPYWYNTVTGQSSWDPPAEAPAPAPAAAQPWAADPRMSGEPLVTTQTEEDARKEFPGDPVEELSHRHEMRMAALRKQLNEYGNTPRWQFIVSFLIMLLTVIGVFFFAQNKWVEGQLEVLMD